MAMSRPAQNVNILLLFHILKLRAKTQTLIKEKETITKKYKNLRAQMSRLETNLKKQLKTSEGTITELKNKITKTEISTKEKCVKAATMMGLTLFGITVVAAYMPNSPSLQL